MSGCANGRTGETLDPYQAESRLTSFTFAFSETFRSKTTR